MSIRAVLFDLGYTLLDYPLQGSWREYLQVRLAEMHPLICPVAAGSAVVTAEEFVRIASEIIGGEQAREIEYSGRSWPFTSRFVNALEALGICCDQRMSEWATESLLETVRARVAPCVDTHGTLTSLQAGGLKLAVVSNSPWDTPGRLGRADMARCGIGEFFGAMLFSGDLPWRKPNPEFMWEAARELGVEPEACLVVGDSLEVDIAGAAAAGMRSIWINREQATAAPDGPQPDWVARTLSEAMGIVRAL